VWILAFGDVAERGGEVGEDGVLTEVEVSGLAGGGWLGAGVAVEASVAETVVDPVGVDASVAESAAQQAREQVYVRVVVPSPVGRSARWLGRRRSPLR
jgi:hypothetical protein